MSLSWDSSRSTKYLSVVFGSEWEKGSYKFFGFRKVPLGWSMNIWRVAISYDNYGKVRSSKGRP